MIKSKDLRSDIFKVWKSVDEKLWEKFKNICGKTGQYDVPIELFQKRTSRKNRVLLRWKTLKENKMTWEALKTFYGGVCVEFVNDDLFDDGNTSSPIFLRLIERIGSDEQISAIVSFRTEDGDSGARDARYYHQSNPQYFNGLYQAIHRKENIKYSGQGNNVWSGNYFASIKGGIQGSIESHSGPKFPQLFNPATEYANELVSYDIDIVMSYFALHCSDLNKSTIPNYDELMTRIEEYLRERVYDEGNLYDYCVEHPSLLMGSGILVDPIQLCPMSIHDFKTSGTEDSSVVCHNEAANKSRFYFDETLGCVLSPARPHNFFWGRHLSNMMQQNYSLSEYIIEEEKRYKLRNAQ